MQLHKSTISAILIIAVTTLAAITITTIGSLLFALITVDGIDRKEIFPIIGSSINTIIGAFVGLLGGLTLNGNAASHEETKETK